MPRPRTSQALNDAVRRVFATVSEKLRQEGKTPAREIASVLGVSRQTAYQYLNGKTALRTWELQLEVKEHVFGVRDFESPPLGPVAEPHQLELDLTDPTQALTEFAVPDTASKLQVGFEGLKVTLTFDLRRTA